MRIKITELQTVIVEYILEADSEEEYETGNFQYVKEFAPDCIESREIEREILED
jgi:hypothetical protein